MLPSLNWRVLLIFGVVGLLSRETFALCNTTPSNYTAGPLCCTFTPLRCTNDDSNLTPINAQSVTSNVSLAVLTRTYPSGLVLTNGASLRVTGTLTLQANTILAADASSLPVDVSMCAMPPAGNVSFVFITNGAPLPSNVTVFVSATGCYTGTFARILIAPNSTSVTAPSVAAGASYCNVGPLAGRVLFSGSCPIPTSASSSTTISPSSSTRTSFSSTAVSSTRTTFSSTRTSFSSTRSSSTSAVPSSASASTVTSSASVSSMAQSASTTTPSSSLNASTTSPSASASSNTPQAATSATPAPPPTPTQPTPPPPTPPTEAVAPEQTGGFQLWYIGIIVGALVLIALAIGLAIFIRKYKKDHRSQFDR